MPYSVQAQQQLEERRGTDAHVLLWFQAKNRTTRAPETLGFWTGDDHREFLIGGEIRITPEGKVQRNVASPCNFLFREPPGPECRTANMLDSPQ